LEELTAAAMRLSRVIAELDGIGLALSTEEQCPQIVARRIREALREVLCPARDAGSRDG
jgi:hypothetical protein